MENTTIRPAQPGDLDAVRDCVTAAYTPYVARIGLRPAPMDADYAALIAEGRVYVATGEDGSMQAVLVVRPLETALLIENVAVQPSSQHQGIGRALLAFAERLAPQQGLTATTLYTDVLMTENIALYQRLGYVETERRGEHGFQRVFMRKQLRPSLDAI